ncbi:MAG: hypothetical protein EZS28_030061 [Streblomastix strix]|uniref:Uncharacterized protein n=1 Tax=Streblomastix strix TaxID=222440 RepID=A0A5J4UWX8_9EUKA|nr:MAG: hypothetical protein EZS28_030061 [Streblomastix strix]
MKILLLVTGQQRHRTVFVQYELEQRVLLAALSKQNDIVNPMENFGGQSSNIGSTTQLKRANLKRIIEAVYSERDRTQQSEDSSESRSSNDCELIEIASGGATCCKDDRHARGEQLFRSILGVTGLGRNVIEIVIESMSLEIWRKKSACIRILNEFFEDQNIDLDKL